MWACYTSLGSLLMATTPSDFCSWRSFQEILHWDSPQQFRLFLSCPGSQKSLFFCIPLFHLVCRSNESSISDYKSICWKLHGKWTEAGLGRQQRVARKHTDSRATCLGSGVSPALVICVTMGNQLNFSKSQ